MQPITITHVMRDGEWREWFEIVPKCQRCRAPIADTRFSLCKHCRIVIALKRAEGSES